MPSCLHFNCFILALHIVTFTFTACLVGGAGGETVEMEMIKYVLYDRNRKVVIKKLVDFTCFYFILFLTYFYLSCHFFFIFLIKQFIFILFYFTYFTISCIFVSSMPNKVLGILVSFHFLCMTDTRV